MDFKIAVCDDEAYFRDRIKELLQKYFAEKGLSVSIDLYDSGASFCSDPDNFKAYDVVFLDIEMREMNGMETAYASLQADVISVALLTGLFLLCAVSTQFGGYYIYRMMAAVASILLFSFIFYSGKWLPRIFLAILFYALYTGASGAVM